MAIDGADGVAILLAGLAVRLILLDGWLFRGAGSLAALRYAGIFRVMMLALMLRRSEKPCRARRIAMVTAALRSPPSRCQRQQQARGRQEAGRHRRLACVAERPAWLGARLPPIRPGHDHPQGACARFFLERLSELAQLAGRGGDSPFGLSRFEPNRRTGTAATARPLKNMPELLPVRAG